MRQEDPTRTLKADRWDALVSSGVSPSEATQRVEQEFAAKKPSAPAGAPGPRDATLGEDVAGVTRQAMNAITFGKYPKMAGAVNRALGIDQTGEQLAQQMAAYKEQNPVWSSVGQVAGTAAQYAAGGALMKGAGMLASRVPAVARALQGAEKAYGAARSVPGGRLMLPTSAASTAQVAATEGIRSAAEAPEDATLGDIAKRTAGAIVGTRLGEIGGTYLAGKFGPTAGKLATQLQEKAQNVGEKINAWKQGAAIEVTAGMARLYDKSKLLRDAVNAEAENLGLMSNSPMVLARAYSRIVQELRGTPDAADVQKTVLQPFLREIDNAAQGKLSPLIRQYSNAMRAQEAGALGQKTMQYIRERVGDASKVSPEVVTRRLSQSYATQVEREAAAARLAEELARGMPVNPLGTLSQVAARVVRPFQGAGTATDVIEQLGGLPLRRQRLTQALFRAAGARTAGDMAGPSR